MPGDPEPLLLSSAESSDSASNASSPSPSFHSVLSELAVADSSLLHPSQHPLRLQDKQPLLPALVTEPLLTDSDATQHSGPPDQCYRPHKRWVYTLPASFERWWAWLDDPLIQALQAPLNSSLRLPVIAFALLLTFFTSIEFGLILPFTLYLTHYDGLADHSLPFMLLLALLSQIPKRFLWRSRPWMVQRALKVRKDKTSSFPSRAVTCAVLYGALLAMAYNVRQIGWGAVVGIAVCGAVLAAIGRVIVGAHYPSDCIFGLLSGTLITLLGEAVYALLVVGCGACAYDSCYTSDPSAALTLTHVPVNWLPIVIVGIAVVRRTVRACVAARLLLDQGGLRTGCAHSLSAVPSHIPMPPPQLAAVSTTAGQQCQCCKLGGSCRAGCVLYCVCEGDECVERGSVQLAGVRCAHQLTVRHTDSCETQQVVTIHAVQLTHNRTDEHSTARYYPSNKPAADTLD